MWSASLRSAVLQSMFVPTSHVRGEVSMLDPRVRPALLEYQAGRRGLEEIAQILARVRREIGCLDLYPSAAATAAEQALLRRFAELVAADASRSARRGAGEGPSSLDGAGDA